MKITRSKQRVEDCLTRFPHLRDDDYKLISTIWLRELQALTYKPKELSAYDLLRIISQGKLSNPESIRRCRAKLQELHKHLRGHNYKVRHKEKLEVQKDLRNFGSM